MLQSMGSQRLGTAELLNNKRGHPLTKKGHPGKSLGRGSPGRRGSKRKGPEEASAWCASASVRASVKATTCTDRSKGGGRQEGLRWKLPKDQTV